MKHLGLLLLTGTCVAAVTFGADWPQFRGPNRDGISTETGWFTPGATGKTVWAAEVGAGYSGLAVKGGRLYTMGYREGKDVVSCLDAATGAKVWDYSYPCEAGSYTGPRCTPTVDGAHVLTLSRQGLLLCLDAGKGTVVWQRDLAKEMNVKLPKWGLASSVLVVGNLALVNVGACGLAVDRASGATKWDSGNEGASYASPVLFNQGGKPAVLVFGEKGLGAADLASGKKLWAHGWTTSWDVNAPDPLVVGDKVLITTGYARGSVLLNVAGEQPKIEWEAKGLSSQFSSPVLSGDYVYSVSGNTGRGDVRCVKLATGETVWSAAEPGFGSLIMADGKLLILNEKGKLMVAEASPEAYREVWNQNVMNGVCWVAPTLCNGLIYCRNEKGRLVCLDLRGK